MRARVRQRVEKFQVGTSSGAPPTKGRRSRLREDPSERVPSDLWRSYRRDMIHIYSARGGGIADYDRDQVKTGEQRARILRDSTGSPTGFAQYLRPRNPVGLQQSTFYLIPGHRSASALRDQMRSLIESGPVFTVSDSLQELASRRFPSMMRELGFRHVERRRLAIDPRMSRLPRESTGNVRFERVRGSDAARIAAIRAYRHHIDAAFGPGGNPTLWAIEYLRSMFARRNPRLDREASFVAVVGGRIVGAVLVTREARSVHIQDLSVRPSHRGRGIGSALMARALAHAASSGSRRVDLTVSLPNPTGAVRLYRRLGFRVDYDRGKAPGLWVHDATRLRLGLKVLGE